MLIKVFENSSHDKNSKVDTSLFVQKLYLRTNYIESNIKEDIDLKNQYRKKTYQILLALQKLVAKTMFIKFLKMILISSMLN